MTGIGLGDAVFNKVLLESEEFLRKQKDIEWGIILDKDGNTLLKKKGTEKSIVFTEAEVFKMKDNVFTHNHPSQQSFSMADIDLLAEYGLSEARAITSGFSYSARLKLPNDISVEDFRIELYKKEYAYRASTQYQLESGIMTWEEMAPEYWHTFWNSLNTEIDYFKYNRNVL